MKYIKWGNCYQLIEDITWQTTIYPEKPIITEFAELSMSGLLTLKRWFVWNGANFVIDRKTNIAGSAFHDAMYEFIQKGMLPFHLWKKIDCEYGKALLHYGAWKITVKLDMIGLAIANGRAAKPENKQKIYEV